MAPLEGLLRPSVDAGNDKFKTAAAKPDVPVSKLLYKIAKGFQRLNPCFRGRGTQWRYRGRIDVVIGSEKFKMAAAIPDIPDVPVSQLIYKIAKKFQLLSACFRSRETQWRSQVGSISQRKWYIWLWNVVILIPNCRHGKRLWWIAATFNF
jgi:hypothetical protein